MPNKNWAILIFAFNWWTFSKIVTVYSLIIEIWLQFHNWNLISLNYQDLLNGFLVYDWSKVGIGVSGVWWMVMAHGRGGGGGDDGDGDGDSGLKW